MADPFRHLPNQCPECGIALRPFAGRLCCDRCEGIFVTLADLAKAIDELVRLEPQISILKEHASKRVCPTCAAAMTDVRIGVTLQDKVIKPKAEIDRCAAHGLWFPAEQLAEVFLAVERVFGSHGGSSGPAGPGGDSPLGMYGKFNAPP
jgi:hypothetical protein